MATGRKPRKKKLKIPVEHAVYGPGEVMEAKFTDSGPVLVVNFADGTTRSLLAAPELWLSLPDLAAIRVAKQKAKPEPEDDDEGDEPVMDEEEPELVAQEQE
jgi:hypothetical protein